MDHEHIWKDHAANGEAWCGQCGIARSTVVAGDELVPAPEGGDVSGASPEGSD